MCVSPAACPLHSIDCTSYFEMESAEYQKKGINLSPSMWLVKMMVSGVGQDQVPICMLSVCMGLHD